VRLEALQLTFRPPEVAGYVDSVSAELGATLASSSAMPTPALPYVRPSRAVGVRGLASQTLRALRAVDHTAGRLLGRRRILVDARSPLSYAALRALLEALDHDSRVDVRVTSSGRADIDRLLRQKGLEERFVERPRAAWSRFDLSLDADPWCRAPLRRTACRVNFFHGVAGKYDLDQPPREARLFDAYDRVGFVNSDRMNRYLSAGIVTPRQAALIGYPKLDALVRGEYDPAAVRAALHFDERRPTVMYAPTWSPVSSLHIAGEAIIDSLLQRGFNVIAKLHDNCYLLDEKYAAGVDWRSRLARFIPSGRFALVEAADSSPYLAASDALVTDHSSIGFEFLALDRPLLVFDAPDLVRIARINPEKVALLRSGARVVHRSDEVGPVAAAELADPTRLSNARQTIVRTIFHQPGTATDRALSMVYELLDLAAPHWGELPCAKPAASIP
jgi:hypothetical protein